MGRGVANELVLEDPSKLISRVHAKISFRAGEFFLVDVGASPSVVNNRALVKGQELMLSHGDRIVIGDYELAVRIDEASTEPVVVFAPLPLTIAPAPFNDPALPLFVAPLPVEKPALPSLPGWNDEKAEAVDLQAGPDPLSLAKILDVTANAHASTRPGASMRDDPLGLNLFGNTSPLAASTSGRLIPARGSPSLSDDIELASPEFAAFSMPSPQVRNVQMAIPDNYDPMADLVAPRKLASPPAPVAVVREPVALTTPPAVKAASAVRLAADQSPDVANDAVLQALLRGLGLPNLVLKGSAPALAETIGALLREATAGTMDLLAARKATKQESPMDMTMILVAANNPLKFFPHAEGALNQMLTSALAGYLPAEQAMSDAFSDLKAHDVAVLAGTRAALKTVLHRVDPAEIERGQSVPGVMDKLMGANRKARMWDQFIESYAGIARDAEDDLQRLFGERFSAAYEDQVKQLRQTGL